MPIVATKFYLSIIRYNFLMLEIKWILQVYRYQMINLYNMKYVCIFWTFILQNIFYSKIKNPQHWLLNFKNSSFLDHLKNCNIWNVRLEKSLFRHKIITTMITYFLLDWERELVREIVDVNYYSINKHVLRKFGVESRSCN